MRTEAIVLSLIAVVLSCCHRPLDGAVGARLALEPVRVVLPGRYQRTHGQVVAGIATPWVEETAQVLGVDVAGLAAKLDLGTGRGAGPVILVSPAHRTGEWTSVRSDAARIYQLAPLRSVAPERRWLAALAAVGPPDGQITDVFVASWTLGLVDRDGGGVAKLRLDTRIPHEAPGLWDVISTSLEARGGKLVVVVEYRHAGGGGACEQRFTFVTRVEPGPRLVLESRDHHEAPCAALGHPLATGGGDRDRSGRLVLPPAMPTAEDDVRVVIGGYFSEDYLGRERYAEVRTRVVQRADASLAALRGLISRATPGALSVWWPSSLLKLTHARAPAQTLAVARAAVAAYDAALRSLRPAPADPWARHRLEVRRSAVTEASEEWQSRESAPP
ncbi:MAG TPA: hypothetical protein VGQ83_08010 [Polyangia bacterium]